MRVEHRRHASREAPREGSNRAARVGHAGVDDHFANRLATDRPQPLRQLRCSAAGVDDEVCRQIARRILFRTPIANSDTYDSGPYEDRSGGR